MLTVAVLTVVVLTVVVLTVVVLTVILSVVTSFHSVLRCGSVVCLRKSFTTVI
jgi:hypothetical protein